MSQVFSVSIFSLQPVRLPRLSNLSKVNSTEECSLPPLTSDSWMEARARSHEVVPVHVHMDTYKMAAKSRTTGISPHKVWSRKVIKCLSTEPSGCLKQQPNGHGKNCDPDEDQNHKKA
jgi:hypothetical protein